MPQSVLFSESVLPALQQLHDGQDVQQHARTQRLESKKAGANSPARFSSCAAHKEVGDIGFNRAGVFLTGPFDRPLKASAGVLSKTCR
mmetsp:Transcript_82731/g.145910  ORF Transcript_82731/g.145910 Transcript_82731/m.145910 type:complete len:88 (+) Transcript_82731:539-802(+)